MSTRAASIGCSTIEVVGRAGLPPAPDLVLELSAMPVVLQPERGCQMIVSIWHQTPVLRVNFSSQVTSVALSVSASAT
jgi:hypothetical protein